MRAHEFENTELEEGWKQNIALASAVGALAFGGANLHKNVSQPQSPQPKITQTVEINLPQPGQELKKLAEGSGIVGAELAQLLAQASHETMDFRHLTELGKSSYFKKYDVRFNPRLAKILGNVNPGDGEKFKGRGFLQVTGRGNYRKLGELLNLPLEQQPELLENPEVAAKASIVYWQKRVQPYVTDFNDTRAVTRKINSGLKGLEDRANRFTEYLSNLTGE